MIKICEKLLFFTEMLTHGKFQIEHMACRITYLG
jgi:hypothetical protein